MQERSSLKEKELKLLAEEYKKNPELFKTETFIDDAETLKELGICIEGKEDFAEAYLKLWPDDFIVEEISRTGQIYTITRENVLDENTLLDQGENPTIYATLVKCGVSTIEAVSDLAAQLRCEKNQIQYAGIKDKDAITAQRISFRRVPFEDLKRVTSDHFFLKDIEAGKGVVETGGLKGNKFTILMRVNQSFFENKLESFTENLKKVKENGFYNFYYTQRFGTPRLNNFIWAFNILKGAHEEAVRGMFTMTSKRELPYFQKIRADIDSHWGDWKYISEKIKDFPLIFTSETRAVNHLLANPSDFLGALMQMPEQVTLWVYALSSWLFNNRLSEYIEEKKAPPAELPLFLSRNKDDWMVYKEFLESRNMLPPPFQNLRPFPAIQPRERKVSTIEHVDLHAAEVTEEGVILSFSLLKGEYATTCLSHLFNIASGKPPEDIRAEQIDTKKIIGEPPLADTVEYFKKIIYPKSANFFENLK